jgi:hypothetical protein
MGQECKKGVDRRISGGEEEERKEYLGVKRIEICLIYIYLYHHETQQTL